VGSSPTSRTSTAYLRDIHRLFTRSASGAKS